MGSEMCIKRQLRGARNLHLCSAELFATLYKARLSFQDRQKDLHRIPEIILLDGGICLENKIPKTLGKICYRNFNRTRFLRGLVGHGTGILLGR